MQEANMVDAEAPSLDKWTCRRVWIVADIRLLSVAQALAVQDRLRIACFLSCKHTQDGFALTADFLNLGKQQHGRGVPTLAAGHAIPRPLPR
eukprot:350777-Chlamydomonas_euryale.AAC.3